MILDELRKTIAETEARLTAPGPAIGRKAHKIDYKSAFRLALKQKLALLCIEMNEPGSPLRNLITKERTKE